MTSNEGITVDDLVADIPNAKVMPEAPASVTWKGYYKGFSVMVTQRDYQTSTAPLLDSAINSIEMMISKGFLPSWAPETNKAFKTQPSEPQAVSGNTCGECGSDMTYKEGVSQKTGKAYKMYKCENGHVKFVR